MNNTKPDPVFSQDTRKGVILDFPEAAPRPKKTSNKLPWMKFYVNDWSGDDRLGMLSLAARGMLVELRCIMHRAEPRGSLVGSDGKPLNNKQIARLCRCTPREAERLVATLYDSGLLGCDLPGNAAFFCPEIRRQELASETGRRTGVRGGNPLLLKERGEAA